MRYEDFLKHLSNNKSEKQAPGDIGVIDYFTQGHFADDALIGTGEMLHGIADMTERAMRPNDMTPSEWKKHQGGLLKDFLTGTRATGDLLKDREVPELEDGSVPYYLRSITRSAPESFGTMGAAYLAGNAVGGPVGGTVSALINAAQKTNKGLALIENLYRAYQAGNLVSKGARALLPTSAKTVAGAEIGALLEANSEKNRAINEYIAKARQNGTYVQDKTELEAEEIGNRVFRDNVGIISAFNLPQYQLLFGNKPVRGLLPNLARTAASGAMEGAEEVAQEYASAYELNEPLTWQRIRDSFVTGAGLGGITHGGGRAMQYVGNREWNLPSEEEIKAEENRYKEGRKQHSEQSQSRYGRYRDDYFGKPSEAAARAAYNQANSEALRDWTRNTTHAIQDDNIHDMIVRTAEKYGVPPEKALAVAMAESNGNQNLVSDAGAIGVMQLMPSTAAGLGVDPNDTAQNIDGGVRYLKQMYDRFKDWDLAFAAYNAGAGTVEKYGGIPDYSETQDYVARIKGFLENAPDSQSGYTLSQSNGQPRSGNIFGVESYNMPTQSSSIDSQVAQLKSGWGQVIPQIGGVLKNRFGINAEISSAARTEEHNAEVGGVPTSHHIIRENGGDALDIVFDRDTTQEEQDRIADYFRSTGLFSEVLYHDVGSGAHLHLGGLQTENLNSFQSRAGRSFSKNYNTNDPTRPSWQEYNDQLDRGEDQSKAEPPKPLFDFTGQDSTTKRLLQQFATKKLTESTAVENHGVFNFFDSMFNEKGEFQDTPENRKAIEKNYRNDFIKWATPFLRGQEQQAAKPEQNAKPAQAPTSKQEIKQQGNKFLNNTGLTEALNQLREKARNENNTALTLKINNAKNDVESLKQLLAENGIDINQPAPQEQENHVQNNTAPENVLTPPQGTAQDTGRERLIKTASAPIDTRKGKQSRQRRQNQAWAMLNLANEYGIKLPNDIFTAIQKGSAQPMDELQKILEHAGAFKTTPAPQNTSTPTSTTPATNAIVQAREQAQKNLEEAIQAARENWNQTKQNYQEQGKRVKQERRDQINAAKPSTQRFARRQNLNHEGRQEQQSKPPTDWRLNSSLAGRVGQRKSA